MAQAKMIYVIYLQLLGRNIQEALGSLRYLCSIFFKVDKMHFIILFFNFQFQS
jgi:hypothetical protein